MQWFRAGKHTLKTVAGEKFISPEQTKFNGGDLKEYITLGGGVVYQVDNVREDAILDFLNVISEKDALAFVRKYGLLGLYWYYTSRGVKNVPLKILAAPMEKIFGGKFAKALEVTRNIDMESPPIEIWKHYREPAGLILKEAERFRDFAKKLLRGESPEERTATMRIAFIDGRPYWIPDAATLIEYLYAWLPVLLADGYPLRVCENETCPRFLVGRKNRYCSTACKNAQNQRELRQRETVFRRIAAGKSFEEATAGLDKEKVRSWLEKGLLY